MRTKAELTFPAELKEKPLICQLCKNFDIILNILEASFSTETGWAVLIFEGNEAEIKKAFDYLAEEGVEIESLEKIH